MNILNMSNEKTPGFLFLALAFITLIALFIGRYPLVLDSSFFDIDSFFWKLFMQVRLPRVLMGLLAGAGLAAAGQVTQTIFKNPLADAGIMGITQGAGFGAALGILLFGSRYFWIQASAFFFSLLALAITLFLSSEIGRDKILSIILAGIAVSALFSSGLGIIKYLADPVDQLPNIVFWLLGSLSAVNWRVVIWASLVIIPLLLFFIFYRWRLNIHALDRNVSFSLGLKKTWETYAVLICSVLLTSVIISVSGVVSWVGLIIPNFSRIVFGADTRLTLFNTILLGGIFIILCDTLARTLLPGEIPLGIFTALIGAAIFIVFLIRKKIYA